MRSGKFPSKSKDSYPYPAFVGEGTNLFVSFGSTSREFSIGKVGSGRCFEHVYDCIARVIPVYPYFARIRPIAQAHIEHSSCYFRMWCICTSYEEPAAENLFFITVRSFLHIGSQLND